MTSFKTVKIQLIFSVEILINCCRKRLRVVYDSV